MVSPHKMPVIQKVFPCRYFIKTSSTARSIGYGGASIERTLEYAAYKHVHEDMIFWRMAITINILLHFVLAIVFTNPMNSVNALKLFCDMYPWNPVGNNYDDAEKTLFQRQVYIWNVVTASISRSGMLVHVYSSHGTHFTAFSLWITTQSIYP